MSRLQYNIDEECVIKLIESWNKYYDYSVILLYVIDMPFCSVSDDGTGGGISRKNFKVSLNLTSLGSLLKDKSFQILL